MPSNTSILFLVLIGFLGVILWRKQFAEAFHFEVSPSKTINCCARGFYGAPIEFHYAGDSTRFQNCPAQPPELLVSADTYNPLDIAYTAAEKFTNTYDALGASWVGKDASEPYTNDFYALGATWGGNMAGREGYVTSMRNDVSARGWPNTSAYANLQQSGQDLQPFVLGVPREHWPINAGHVDGASKIFAGPFPPKSSCPTRSVSEPYCGSCRGGAAAGPNA